MILLAVSGGAQAAIVGADPGETHPGQPIHQQFLDGGASIVTTQAGRSCMVSRRIGIETSDYRDEAGRAVPFAAIRRSPATSVQAGDDGSGAVWYRVQMKYPVDRDRPVTLSAGGVGRDLGAMLEPSGDSLLLTGAAAAALSAAFAAGGQPLVEAWSSDTGHRVTDRLEAPDATALAACVAALPAAAPAPMVTNEVRVAFAGTRETAPLATLPDLQACGMTEPPGALRLVRLDSVTGFFAHTDRAFVAFDARGAVRRFYISGIFDADIGRGSATGRGPRAGRRTDSGGGAGGGADLDDTAGTVRLSRAADANLPDAANAVKGCLGAAAQPICSYDTGKGNHLLADCFDPSGNAGLPPDGPVTGGGTPPRVATLLPPGQPPGGGGPGGPPGGGPPGGGPPDDVTRDTDPPPPPPPPAPVPLPATGLLLLGAFGGVLALRRRRAG